MINIEHARPTPKKILSHIEEFELYCMGQHRMTPEKFRNLNTELSIGAVLMIGKRRYERNPTGKHMIWKGLDGAEYDLGPIHNPNIMRDFPGFHARRSLSLGNHMVINSHILEIPGKRGNVTVVTLTDGTDGVGPNFRMALRNAALKSHLKSPLKRFNPFAGFFKIWNATMPAIYHMQKQTA